MGISRADVLPSTMWRASPVCQGDGAIGRIGKLRVRGIVPRTPMVSPSITDL